MRPLTVQEDAARWLYHHEYARGGQGAIEFYKHLPEYQKDRIQEMIDAILSHQPKKRGRS